MADLREGPDLKAELGSPFSDDVLHLELDERLRAFWQASGLVRAEYDPDTAQGEDNPTPRDCHWSIEADLGTVEHVRRMVDGGEDRLETTHVLLHVDSSGHEDYCGLFLNIDAPKQKKTHWGRDLPKDWPREISAAFQAILHGLCAGGLPSSFADLSSDASGFDAQRIIDDDWTDGTYVFNAVASNWWHRSIAIDVGRLVRAIAKGENHERRAKWAVIQRSNGVEFLCPLVIDTYRVALAHVEEPLWLCRRYWLTVVTDGDEALQDVRIRTDQPWSQVDEVLVHPEE